MFPVLIQLADLLYCELPVVGVFHQLLAELALDVKLDLLRCEIGYRDLTILHIIIQVIDSRLPNRRVA